MKSCYARFDADCGVLLVGNDKIEKKIQINGGLYRTESVTDKIGGAAWSGESPWQRVPILNEGETPEISFESGEQENRIGIKPHLEAKLRFFGERGEFCLELAVFPRVPFVYSRSTVFAREIGESNEKKTEGEDCSGIEKAQSVKALGEVCGSDTLDCIPLGRRHMKVESICLYDKTDVNDTLVERQTASVYSRGSLERRGNIFSVNDYPNGDSLMLVKHSPTQSSALHRVSPDLVFKGDKFVSLMGSGVDYSALPKEEIPCYASAVGVGRTDGIIDACIDYFDCYGGSPEKELFVMSNTWGDRSQDARVCESFVLGELERARLVGVDIMQIDDGWQKGVTANSRRQSGGVWEGYYAYDDNFWQVDPARFPRGLDPIVKKATECGVEVGLWFSPDSSRDFLNVERDVETLLSFYKNYGIRHFKLDGIKVRNKLCEKRLVYLLESVSARSGGEVQFNLDVTAEDRFGYLYNQQYGTLFVENRYTDWGNYYPHRTFKNVWDLAGVMPCRRLQMEILNVRRNKDKYEGLPFAPDGYSMDYLFATVMVANPLVWAELTGLGEADADALGRMIKLYKPYKKELFSSRVIPVGERPDGMSFSGFQCVRADGLGGHLLLFRETTAEESYSFKLPRKISPSSLELVCQSADARLEADGDTVTVTFSAPRSFVWVKYEA